VQATKNRGENYWISICPHYVVSCDPVGLYNRNIDGLTKQKSNINMTMEHMHYTEVPNSKVHAFMVLCRPEHY
jgi:hypothetical protein